MVQVASTDRNTTQPITIDFTTTWDLRARSRSFESISLYRDGDAALVGGGQPELVRGMRVNYDYFHTLGTEMQLGRAFLPEEDRPATRNEIILTHALWMRRFGGDPQILGRKIQLNEASFTVVGVLPAKFQPVVRPGADMP